MHRTVNVERQHNQIWSNRDHTQLLPRESFVFIDFTDVLFINMDDAVYVAIFTSDKTRVDQILQLIGNDNVVQNDRHLTVQGWLANDYAMTKPYAYAILIQNGQEIGRQRLEFSERDDVAKAYPQIYRSQYSGFNTSFDLPTASTNGLQLVLRFTDDPAGNGNSSDQWIKLNKFSLAD